MKFFALTLTILLIPASVMVVDSYVNERHETQRTLNHIRTTEFSMENLQTYLELKNAPDPKIMMSQFALETGWFSSRLFIEGNNLAGMKLPAKRETTAIGELLGHARYNHWTDSVDDFLLWLDFHSLSEGYLHHLKSKGYAKDPVYFSKVMSIYKRDVK